ncbi:MAG: hypothetical protein GQ531_10095 [Sulfurovum sp.]|nr:hypothetical protein [Sulfurovum sp.]
MKMKLILALGLMFGLLHASDLETQIEACKNGNGESCYTAGIALTTGENAEDQEKKTLGLEYLRKSCKYGVNKACDAMGVNYYEEKHFGAARPYLEGSCKRGIVDACEGLGTIYRDGHDIRANDTLSREYYEDACDLNSSNACYAVAIVYRGGFGVEKSRSKEKAFYKKACDFGNEDGCERFTTMDNADKGIEEPGLWEKFKSLFN